MKDKSKNPLAWIRDHVSLYAKWNDPAQEFGFNDRNKSSEKDNDFDVAVDRIKRHTEIGIKFKWNF